MGGAAESIASSQVELDELDEMSVTDASEKAQLMRKLKEHQEMQKQIQEEMDTQSLATTVPPLPSQVSFCLYSNFGKIASFCLYDQRIQVSLVSVRNFIQISTQKAFNAHKNQKP